MQSNNIKMQLQSASRSPVKGEPSFASVAQTCKLVNGFSSDLFSTAEWNLSDRTFRDKAMGQLFEQITECRAIILSLDYNKMPSILKAIQHPRYTQLESIFLGDNTIKSIEIISRIYMPCLIKLHLNDNLISEISALRKCHIPQIEYISLRNNKIPVEHPQTKLTELECPMLLAIMTDYSNSNMIEQNSAWMRKGRWQARGGLKQEGKQLQQSILNSIISEQ